MRLGAASALELVDSAVGLRPRLAHERFFSEASPEGTSANRAGSAWVNPLGVPDPSPRNGERRHLRFHEQFLHLSAPFGCDWFGRKAETFARLFGTPTFLLTQTSIVIVWIAVNVVWAVYRWDPYPFILLNLAFSLQAAYAAPLILLAQTRQADRDKTLAIADAEHRDALARESLQRQEDAAAQAEQLRVLLESNTRLTAESAKLGEQVERLTREIHARVCAAEQA